MDFLRTLHLANMIGLKQQHLEVLCRLYVDGKLSVEVIYEIDNNISDMRYETNLYFAQALLARRKNNESFDKVISNIKSESFREALEELST